MSHPEVLSTALDIPKPKKWFSIPIKPVEVLRRRRVTNERPQDDHQDPEFKLPKRSSLIIVIVLNLLMQLSFFIIVSSSNLYAAHLGGSATFSGLVIGIPTLISGLCLLPLMKIDQGVYRRPMHFACGSAVLGHILYAIAYKKYCSDSRIVGVRRRTFLAGWLVVTQALGFSLGPFMGGLLYKVGFSNDIFNGYTSPAWVMAIIWSIFWLVSTFLFEDVPLEPPVESEVEMTSMENINIPEGKEDSRGQSKASSTAQVTNIESVSEPERFRMSSAQWGVTATMIWFAMTCFFVLGAWEANIPAFTGSDSPLSPFHFSPFAAGNLIALGGACTFPFLFLNIFVARKIQDRITLAVGSSLGCAGLFIALAILKTRTVNYGSFFICWFLVALGFNLASTVTLSLLSKQLPGKWNSKVSIMIQCGNYTGRVTDSDFGDRGCYVLNALEEFESEDWLRYRGHLYSDFGVSISSTSR
ncbi:MFS transporter superfamily protein [Abortiporus biennis]